MYLNVNLTPPTSGGLEGSCAHTPKTPEILNSLISLTSTPASSYTTYSCEANPRSDLLSPASSISSPCEEKPGTQFGATTPSGSGPQMSPTSSFGGISDPGGGAGTPCPLTKVTGAFRRVPAIAGTPSPPVPELPSPVNTVEATKSALIKEGLKHQIKSKLQAAGLAPCELLSEAKLVKEEVSDSRELTPQDEERRMRRRERNKIAATKCRNKKKEKTIILLTESESVEDQNLRLKTEIQRLTSEKVKLEKLLEDPKHVASCKHSCKSSRHRSGPPLVVVTSPGAPKQLLSSSSADGIVASTFSGASPDGLRGGGSDQSPEMNPNLSYHSPNSVTSGYDLTQVTQPSSPPRITLPYSTSSSSPSCPSSALSPCSLPSVSPPQLTMSPSLFSPRTSSQQLMTTSSQALPPISSSTTTSYTSESSLLSLSYSSPSGDCDRIPNTTSDSSCTLNSNLPVTSSEPLSIHSPSKSHSTSSPFLSPGPSLKLPNSSSKRHLPYSLSRSPRALPFLSALECAAPTITSGARGRDSFYNVSSKMDTPSPFVYPSPSQQTTCSSLEVASVDNCSNSIATSSSRSVEYIAAKARITPLSPSSSTHCRYTPYDRSDRSIEHQQNQTLHQLSPPQPPTHHNLHSYPSTSLPQSYMGVSAIDEGVVVENSLKYSSYELSAQCNGTDPYLMASCNASASCHFLSDGAMNQFYPSFSYGNVATFDE